MLVYFIFVLVNTNRTYRFKYKAFNFKFKPFKIHFKYQIPNFVNPIDQE